MNKGLKWSIIACLLLALAGAVMYFRIRMSAETRHLFLPIAVLNLPEGLTFASEPPKGISMTVSGPAAIVHRLAIQHPPYPLDLAGASAGTTVIEIGTAALDLPPELTEVRVQPLKLMVTLETASVKTMPVVVTLVGQPAPGFTVVDTLVQPAAITVRGPASLIDPMDRVITRPVNLEGLSESFRKEIAVALPETVTLVASTRIAAVDIRIAERVETRKISDISVTTPQSSYPAAVSPPVITLELRGPIRMLDRLDFNDGTAGTGMVSIDTSQLKPGVHRLRAAIQVPVNTTLVSASPDFFTVTIGAKTKTPSLRKSKPPPQ